MKLSDFYGYFVAIWTCLVFVLDLVSFTYANVFYFTYDDNDWSQKGATVELGNGYRHVQSNRNYSMLYCSLCGSEDQSKTNNMTQFTTNHNLRIWSC